MGFPLPLTAGSWVLKTRTIKILSPTIEDPIPTYWNVVDRLFFRWPRFETPSSIKSALIPFKAWFLPSKLKSVPIFYPLANKPYPEGF